MLRTKSPENYRLYAQYKKPKWAPPAWLFAPVWSVLYLLIAASYGVVFYLYLAHELPLMVALPFALNLIFNFAYTPLQFGLRRYALATADILLVLATLAWALWAIYPHAAWVSLINLPYLAWVCFATVLQLTVVIMNRDSR